MYPNKLRDKVHLRHAGYVERFQAPGFEISSGLGIEPYTDTSDRFIADVHFFSSVIVDNGDDKVVIAQIKQRMTDQLVHYFYKDIVDSLYTTMSQLSRGQEREAVETIMKALDSINGRDTHGK